MQAGDGFLLNDPWDGGSHLPDLTLVVPLLVAALLSALDWRGALRVLALGVLGGAWGTTPTFVGRLTDFITPRFRQNQVLEFLKEPMNDLCISRPKTRLTWGIELPFDTSFVTYVWFDALTNYYSAVADKGLWPADVHVIGKDILSPPHAVYWPCMLKALGIEPPRQLLVHGWWTVNNQKASKSAGNAADTLGFVASHGPDAFRFYLCREMVVGQDADFSELTFNNRYKADLGNNLGNLVNRLLNMVGRNYAGALLMTANEVNTEHLLNYRKIIVTADALETLSRRTAL